MAPADAHLELIRRALAAIEHRDPSALQSTLHPEVVWHELGSTNPIGGDYTGVGEVLSFIAGLYEQTGGSLHVDVHDTLANDEHGVAMVRLHGLAPDGKQLDDRTVFVVHFREGLVGEVWSYAQDQVATDAFWATRAAGA